MSEDEKTEEKKSSDRWKIIGYNILTLVTYTLLFRFVDGGIMIDCFFVGIHVLACIALAIGMRRWEWVLSAFLVLAIGFSTCVTFLDMPNMH
jgi:hypothetical protein